MIDFAQSQLVVLIAGAVLASTLLGAAGYSQTQREQIELAAAVDAIAAGVGSSGCSASRPSALIETESVWRALDAPIASALLFADHVRAVRPGGHSVSSVEFSPLALERPLEIGGAHAIRLTFQPMAGRCSAAVVLA